MIGLGVRFQGEVKLMKIGWLVTLAWVAGMGLQGEARAQVMPTGGEHEAMAHIPAKPSTTLVVTVDGKATTFTLDDLKGLAKTAEAKLSVFNAHTKVQESYEGVSVEAVLKHCGFSDEGSALKRVYHSYVRAEGTDGYWVLYSASELMVTNSSPFIAFSVDGKDLGEEGQFKIVAQNDRKPARWVRNLRALTVVTVE